MSFLLINVFQLRLFLFRFDLYVGFDTDGVTRTTQNAENQQRFFMTFNCLFVSIFQVTGVYRFGNL